MKPADLLRRVGAAPLLLFGVLVCTAPRAAEPLPNTDELVEALTPKPAPRTRSARNLVVREKAAADGAATAPAEERPNVSLAVQFDFDSARLKPDGEAALERLAAALRSPQLVASRFLVEGHTDARGSTAYNQRLSQARAEEVRRYLQTLGVAAERVDAVGRGAQALADPERPHAAENRRVRVVNLETAVKP